jgi:hypothetical protein
LLVCHIYIVKLRNRMLHTGIKLVKDVNSDLLADSQNILNRWKSYFSRFLNVHNVSVIRQI